MEAVHFGEEEGFHLGEFLAVARIGGEVNLVWGGGDSSEGGYRKIVMFDQEFFGIIGEIEKLSFADRAVELCETWNVPLAADWVRRERERLGI